MSFSDFPFVPEVMGNKSHDSRRFPSHTEVQAWLEIFAAKFDLRRHIRFNSQITSLRPVSSVNSNFSSKHSNPEQPSPADTPSSVKSAPRWKLKVQKAPTQQAAQQDTQHAKHEPHVSYSNDATSHSEPGPSASSSSNARDGSSAAAASTPHAASSDPVEPDDSINDRCFSDDFRPRDGSVDQNGTQHHTDSAACDYSCLNQHAHDHRSHAQTDSEHQLSALSESSAVSQPNSDGQSEYEFDSVVVCVGNYHQPNLPDIKGIDDFTGLQMHAHNYRSNSMFAGMRVIIVGASFSGTQPPCLCHSCGEHSNDGACSLPHCGHLYFCICDVICVKCCKFTIILGLRLRSRLLDTVLPHMKHSYCTVDIECILFLCVGM